MAFANFVYFCIACGNCYHIWAEYGSNFRTQYKSSIQTLQGYIFRILQHFATKLCNFTHFILSICCDLFASRSLPKPNLVPRACPTDFLIWPRRCSLLSFTVKTEIPAHLRLCSLLCNTVFL